jgi:hypothetical protein
MANVTLDKVIELADELSPQDRGALLLHLTRDQEAVKRAYSREAILAEHERLKASGAFDRAESLADRYARPELQLEYEEIETILREAGSEWEKEIDELDS